ncbi:MAG: hypothetical protein ACFCUN_04875 [Hyphomicrobiaceae bacterium]
MDRLELGTGQALITVEALLFAALGFVVAGLLALATGPLVWARATHLARQNVFRSMPVTRTEIAADRGLLRAQYALAVTDLEGRLDRAGDREALARIEINRRDAEIVKLNRRIAELVSDLATNENARRVLERTIIERVPDVERHLRDARAALTERDHEMEDLRVKSTKTLRALDEAMLINEQQRREITRLATELELREAEDKARSATTAGAPGPATALEAELAQLRAKSQEQAALIRRLQSVVAQLQRDRPMTHEDRAAIMGALADAQEGRTAPPPLARDGAVPIPLHRDTAILEAKVKRLEGRLEDREREVRALTAQIAALEASGDQEFSALAAGRTGDGATERPRSLKAVNAKLVSLEAQTKEREATIARLRSELAAANERLARQAQHFSEELKRLGSVRRSPSGDRGQIVNAAEPSRRASLMSRIENIVSDPATRVTREDDAANAGRPRQTHLAEIADRDSGAHAASARVGGAASEPTRLQAAPPPIAHGVGARSGARGKLQPLSRLLAATRSETDTAAHATPMLTEVETGVSAGLSIDHDGAFNGDSSDDARTTSQTREVASSEQPEAERQPALKRRLAARMTDADDV